VPGVAPTRRPLRTPPAFRAGPAGHPLRQRGARVPVGAPALPGALFSSLWPRPEAHARVRLQWVGAGLGAQLERPDRRMLPTARRPGPYPTPGRDRSREPSRSGGLVAQPSRRRRAQRGRYRSVVWDVIRTVTSEITAPSSTIGSAWESRREARHAARSGSASADGPDTGGLPGRDRHRNSWDRKETLMRPGLETVVRLRRTEDSNPCSSPSSRVSGSEGQDLVDRQRLTRRTNGTTVCRKLFCSGTATRGSACVMRGSETSRGWRMREARTRRRPSAGVVEVSNA
jgi:hypothetical protein